MLCSSLAFAYLWRGGALHGIYNVGRGIHCRDAMHGVSTVNAMAYIEPSSVFRHAYHVTLTRQQLRPLPTPTRPTWLPSVTRPSSTACARLIGIAAGPMLPSTGKL